MALFLTPYAIAEEYKVVVLPDNVVMENEAVDSYIYNASSEFFANEIINILNNTDFIKSPTVSEERLLLKSSSDYIISVRNLTNRYKVSYNIDFMTLKKVAKKNDARYVLLITSSIDSENYILRRTAWDVLNIPGASVVDPAYKISTYAVLVDTEKNAKLWSDTYYKTISVCENRIITRGPSPQTEQLQKIKDYSKLLCPQIARNVQRNILPASVYEEESTQIDYDLGNIDNVFTKKYRQLGNDYNKIYEQKKQNFGLFVEDKKQKHSKNKQRKLENQAIKKDAEQIELNSKMEVKATPVYENNIKDINYKKTPIATEEEYVLPPIEIERTKKNTLYEVYESDRPDLRDYYQ